MESFLIAAEVILGGDKSCSQGRKGLRSFAPPGRAWAPVRTRAKLNISPSLREH
jgi:hypothetical protein